MKKYFILTLLWATCLWSQHKPVLYNFTAIPQSLAVNPGADVSYQWYAGIPLLSGVNANVGASGFTAYDLFADNGVDFNTKLRNTLAATTRNDKLSAYEQLELFQGGFKLGRWDQKAYLSFGMYQEFEFLGYVPKDLAILALEGNQNYLGKNFNLGDLNARADMLTVFHVGYHQKVSNTLTWGVRGKIYSSIYNVRSTQNKGYLYTVESNDKTFYEQVIAADMLVNTSGIAAYFDANREHDVRGDITKRAFFGGNLGLGMDVGFTYYPQKNVQFTASLTDIGFIRHSKNVESYRAKGTYNYKGILPDFFNGTGGNNITEEFNTAFPRDTLYSSYTTWRPVKLNSSIQYAFGQDRATECNCVSEENQEAFNNAVGLQLFAMSSSRAPIMALTAFYRKKIFKGLQAKATYTIDAYSASNIGLGMSSQIGPVNFYVLAENLLALQDLAKAQSAAFQLGINIIVPERR